MITGRGALRRIHLIATSLALLPLVSCAGDPDGGAAGSASSDTRSQRPPGEQLLWVSRQGNIEGLIGEARERIYEPALSPSADQVAARELVDGNHDIYVHTLASGETLRFTLDDRVDTQPGWSPDGKRIAFASYRSGDADLYVRSLSRSLPVTPVGQGPLDEYYPDWTPDGSRLTYHHRDPNTNERDIWIRPIQGGQPVALISGPAREAMAQLSPDGAFLAYQSDETGRWEVFVISFPAGGGKVQVSRGGGLWPRWADEGELFFVSDATMAVSVVERSGGIRVSSPRSLWSTASVGMRDPARIVFVPMYDVASDGEGFVVVQTRNP